MKKIEIPITINFDKTKQIGVAIIDADALPTGANYRFDPGFKVLELKETKQGKVVMKAELIELSLTVMPLAQTKKLEQPKPVPPLPPTKMRRC